jgi:CRP/FNR family cyclic AMP-dependent transcriptional regulator
MTIDSGEAMPEIAAAKKVVLTRGWLSTTPPDFQQRVIDQCQYRKVRTGTRIFKLGDPAGGMFGVASGGVAVEIAPAERGPFIASLMLPGGWFGDAAAITGRNRRVGVLTTRDSELLYLPVPAINTIVASDPDAWRYFFLNTMGHFDTAISLCDDLMRREHAHRFVAVLLHLCGCRFHSPPPSEAIDLDIGQEELANIANVARTTAGAVLRDLEKSGHLELSYRRVRILSPNSLRSMLVR